MTYNWLRIVSVFICFFVIGVSSKASDLPLTQDTLVIGSISTKPSKSFKSLTPLSQYLQVQLSDVGINRVKIKVAKNIKQMQKYINTGEVDIISETMLTAVKLENVDINLLRWKRGVDQYQTLLITQIDSDIHSIEDLIGRTIGLEDSASTSGYLIPMLDITEITNQVHKKENIQQDNSAGKINYIFSTEAYATSIDNLAIWTHRSIVDAAAISDLDWVNDRKFPDNLKRDLRIFHRSALIPRSLTMYRSNLDSDLKNALTRVLTNVHNDDNGKEALQLFTKTKKFTLLTDQEKQNIENAREGYSQRIKPVE